MYNNGFTWLAIKMSCGKRYLKLFLAVGLAVHLSGCTSVDTLVSQNAIRVGMTKTDVANVVLWQGSPEDDAWLGGCFYEYIRESRCEILAGSARNQYLVFCGAYSESSCYIREGASTLRGVYRTYSEAKRAAAPTQTYAPAADASAPSVISRPAANNERESAVKIQRCTKKGLTPGTPAFKKCFAEQ